MLKQIINPKFIFFLIYTVVLSLIVIQLYYSPEENTSFVAEIDGLIYKAGSSDPLTGEVSDTVNNKIIKYNVINGIKQGSFMIYSSDGKIEVEGKVQNNKNVGEWRYYYPNGTLESIGNFVNDLPDGEWKWFYPDGALKEIGYFIEGKKEGTWVKYDQEGLFQKSVTYIKGEVVNEVIRPQDYLI
ncbi:MAG: hypothetical protein Kow0098_14450 [Ignavibacteriaceae bacterium]